MYCNVLKHGKVLKVKNKQTTKIKKNKKNWQVCMGLSIVLHSFSDDLFTPLKLKWAQVDAERQTNTDVRGHEIN